jgi:hypothetical protein
VLLFVDPQHEEMDLAAILREIGSDLVRDEHPGEVCDLESTVDAVVVGDRHEVHPGGFRPPVDLERLHERLRRSDAAQQPLARAIGVLAVDVDVDPRFVLGHGDTPPSPGVCGATVKYP